MIAYSIFNSQPDFLSRKRKSEWSTSVSTVKTDVTSHCSAGTAGWQTQNQSPLEGVAVGRADSHTAQTAAPGQPSPTTQQLQSTLSSAHPN